MRCPICDYDNDLPPDLQSSFFSGLSFDVSPNPYLDAEGEIKCNCFSFDGQEDLTEGFEDDEET